MLKKILLLLIFFSFSNCGYSPIYSKSNKINFTINSLKFEGDRQINNYLKAKLLSYNSAGENIHDFEIISNYTKIILSKDATGAAADYQLNLNLIFKVRSEDVINNYSFNETFLLKKEDDNITERNYENTVKQNLVDTIFDKFILEMMNK